MGDLVDPVDGARHEAIGVDVVQRSVLLRARARARVRGWGWGWG